MAQSNEHLSGAITFIAFVSLNTNNAIREKKDGLFSIRSLNLCMLNVCGKNLIKFFRNVIRKTLRLNTKRYCC